MPDPLLITKLHPPVLSVQSIARPRLTGLLNDSLQAGRPLILISAPAGFGKTSLLTEWIPQSDWRVAWLGLDEEDNDQARFWAYFAAALQTLRKDQDENGQAAFSARRPLAPPDETYLTVLLNELSTFTDPFVIVLDDYHLIDTPAIHSGLTFLVDHTPWQMHLILVGRSDPPLPLARWRATSQLVEIRDDDLRFTTEEASAFLIEVSGLPLSTGEVHALVDHTEGWIAGLQLAALSMQGRQDIPAFIHDFTGSHYFIVDYLSEEILQRQPEPVKSFMLHTSILNRMCGPLCEAVTGQSGGQEMLEYLERSNLFVQRLDDERIWYRYHQLFVEVLRHHLRQTQADLIPELQHNASVWYEQNGLPTEAIWHALVGKDFERTADLVEANSNTIYWRRGEISTVLRWLEALPDELVRQRPQLCLLHAWTLLVSGQIAAVEPRLEDLEELLAQKQAAGGETVEIQGLRGQIAAIRARLARLGNDLPRSIELCHRALEYLPPDDVFLRGVISLNLGLAYWQSGDIVAARRVLAETSAIMEPGEVLSTSLAAQSFLADIQVEQGHLHHAARIYQQTIKGADQTDQGPSPPIVAWAYIGMSEVLRQWNDLDESVRCLEKGLQLATLWGNADGLAWAAFHLARWKATLGVSEEAEEALSQAEQIVQQSRVAPWTAAGIAGYRGEFLISQGRISEAVQWAQEQGLEAEDEISYQRLPEYLAFIRLLLSQGKFNRMERLVESLLALAEGLGLNGRIIEIRVLQALGSEAQEKSEQAAEALGHALALAEPEGYQRLFLDAGEQMKLLLQKYLRHQDPKRDIGIQAYATGLLASSIRREAKQEGVQSPVSGQSTLAELLSERELEILQLLSDGLTNREIAQRLYISIGTVKVHLRHIYRKLEVGNRTEAAARAHQLSLI